MSEQVERVKNIRDAPDLTIEALEDAIRSSIEANRFFSAVDPDAELILRVDLRRAALISEPEELTDETQVVIDWFLEKRGAEQVLWNERIMSNCVKTFSDYFNGYRRVSASVEGAVRSNIEQGLRALDASGALEGMAR